ncbi:MAG: hypothetical protein ACOX8B_07770 [Lachnospiraceae bacterium]
MLQINHHLLPMKKLFIFAVSSENLLKWFLSPFPRALLPFSFPSHSPALLLLFRVTVFVTLNRPDRIW